MCWLICLQSFINLKQYFSRYMQYKQWHGRTKGWKDGSKDRKGVGPFLKIGYKKLLSKIFGIDLKIKLLKLFTFFFKHVLKRND